VIARRRRPFVSKQKDRRIEIADIEHVRSRRNTEVNLVELVAE